MAGQDRAFEILANGTLIATEQLTGAKPGQFLEKRYSVPAEALSAATDGRVTVKFSGKSGSNVGSIFDVRLMRPAKP